MNLRTLKKLSKRAAPLLPLLGDKRQQFPAEREDNYTGLLVTARKHFERGRSVHADLLSEGEIKTPAKDGRGWVYAHPPCHPRKGTMMVGGMSGYYEPEWDEETAWEALQDLVFWEFADFDGEDLIPTRQLRTAADVFRAADELISQRASKRHAQP